MPAGHRDAYLAGDALDELDPIGKFGQLIEISQVLEPLLLFQMMDGKDDVAGQFRQQFQFVGVKEIGLPRIHCNGPYRLVRGEQRQRRD